MTCCVFGVGAALIQAACYENKTKLFASSEVPIQQVFSDKSGKQEGYDAHMRSSRSLTSIHPLANFSRCTIRSVSARYA